MDAKQNNKNGPAAYNEQIRLAAIRNLEILDTPPDGTFDRLTRLASRMFNVPIAIVSIVDADRIWFKSKLGLELTEIERKPGLCSSCILQDDVLVIPDARNDPASFMNPLVAGEFGLRFYAGAPLKTAEGLNIGTFCLVDRQPRAFTEIEKANLTDLAAMVIDAMELRLATRKLLLQNMRVVEDAEKSASTDPLTGLGNRRAMEMDISAMEGLAKLGSRSDMMVTIVDLDGLKQINDKRGHAAGDELLIAFSAGLQKALRSRDNIYRVGGDEFVIFSPFDAEPDSLFIKNRIAAVLDDIRDKNGFPEAGASIGSTALSDTAYNIRLALNRADKKMYEEKKARISSLSSTGLLRA
jgi:diguanylate cyclase (GGDEF)-like protein